jgi:hypothetical protein
MPIYYCKFRYPGWGNLYHKIVAPTQAAAIKKMIQGSRIPAIKVQVWHGSGLPKNIAGK